MRYNKQNGLYSSPKRNVKYQHVDKRLAINISQSYKNHYPDNEQQFFAPKHLHFLLSQPIVPVIYWMFIRISRFIYSVTPSSAWHWFRVGVNFGTLSSLKKMISFFLLLIIVNFYQTFSTRWNYTIYDNSLDVFHNKERLTTVKLF